MGEIINLRRVRKSQQRRAADAEAAVSRRAHGAPKHLKKLVRSEKQRAGRIIDAHKLDPEGRR